MFQLGKPNENPLSVSMRSQNSTLEPPSPLVKGIFNTLSEEKKAAVLGFKVEQFYPLYHEYLDVCEQLYKLYNDNREYPERTCSICPHLGRKIEQLKDGQVYKQLATTERFVGHWRNYHVALQLCAICGRRFSGKKKLNGHMKAMAVHPNKKHFEHTQPY